jgi:membrane fusion protein (multidrug efflux system)
METKEEKGLSKKKIILISTIFLFIVGTFVFIQYKKTHISTDDAYITNDIYWIHPRVSGSVEKVFIDNNKYVKKGDVLAIINQKPYKIALDEALAKVELYRAKVEEAKVAISASKSQIELIKAKMEKAQWDFDRAKRLYKTKVLSKNRYEDYLTNYKVIKYTLLAKQDELKQTKALYKSAKKALNAALSTLDQAKLYLSYTEIKAPKDGFIAKKGIEVGKFAAPQAPICAIVPNEGAWIVANYKESQIKRIKKGEEVRIEIDAYPDKEFKGVVDSMQFGTGEVFSLFPPQNASGNWVKVTQRIPVKILFKEKPDVELRVGMSTKVTVLAK